MLTFWRRRGVAPGLAAVVCAGALGLSGCVGAPDGDADAAPAATDGGSTPYDASVSPPGDGAAPKGEPCGTGRGRLRVTVSLDPEVALQEPDVWLSLRCGPAESPVRLVRWARPGVHVLDGLGPGLYRLYASSQVAPGQWSPQVGVEGAATVALPLTVASEAAVLGGAASDDLGEADAGVLHLDAGLPDARLPDAALAPAVWRRSGGLLDPGSRQAVGTVEVEALALDGGVDAGEPRMAVQATLRSACATPPCPALSLHSVELRLSEGEAPIAVASMRFEDGTRLDAGGRFVLPRPLLLPGRLPGGARVLRLTVYGDVSGAERRR